MGVVVTVPPAAEPIDIVEAKAHLRVTTPADDALIGHLISAARIHAEAFTGRAFVTQTITWTLDGFPGWTLAVPRPPLRQVTSITYLDPAGVAQVLDPAAYRVDAAGWQGRITPAYGLVWPQAREVIAAVSIAFDAGYGAGSAVPAPIIAAIKLILGALYERRGDDAGEALPAAARALLGAFRVEPV